MADEPVEVTDEPEPEADNLNRPSVVTRVLRSGGGRIDDDPLELPAHLKSIFAEPQPGSILHTIQKSSKNIDALGGVLHKTSAIDAFINQNSIMSGMERFTALNSVGDQFAELQQQHREKMDELVKGVQPINTPAIRMVGLLNDMRDALEQSSEHNRQVAEALFADAVRQEEQIRELREANVSLRQAVDRAESDAKNAEKSSEDNRRLANIGVTIGVIGLILAVASIVVTVMTAKG